MLRALAIAVFLGHLSLFSPPAAAAQPRDAEAEARVEFERGVALTRAEDWEGALEAFEASLASYDRATTLFNIAVTLDVLGRGPDCVRAIDRLMGRSDVTPTDRAAAAALRERWVRRLGELRVEISPPGAREGSLSVDGRSVPAGQRRIWVEPGLHVVRAAAPGGFGAREVEVTAHAGSPTVVSLSLEVAVESTASACRNGADDDGDGKVDCADSECEEFVFCAPPAEVIAPVPDAPAPPPSTYPTQRLLQPQTLREGMLSPFTGFAILEVPAFADPLAVLQFGATYGVFDYWEIWASILNVLVSPLSEVANPILGTTLRLYEDEIFEASAFVQLTVPLVSDTAATLILSVPLILRLDTVARLEAVALGLVIDFNPPTATTSLFTSFRLLFQAGEYAFGGFGAEVYAVGNGFDEVLFPLLFVVGASIPGLERGPLGAAELQFTFPRFGQTGGPGPAITTDIWQLSFALSFYSFLL